MAFPSPPPAWRRPAETALVAALVLALLGLLFWPTLRWLGLAWRVNPYYSHGPLVLLAAAFLVWRGRERWRAGAPALGPGLALVAAGAGLQIAARPWSHHLLSAAGLLIALAGLGLLIAGRPALRALLFPLGLLALAVPLPWMDRIAPWLAAEVAASATYATAFVGADVARRGAELVIGGDAMTVGAPCSGLRSLVSLATLAVLLAGILEGAPLRRMALVALAVPLALLANGLRLAGLIWVVDLHGAELGLAYFHGPSSPLLFLGALALLLGSTRLLGIDVPAAA